MKLAVIDIGSNSLHMLLVEVLPNFTFEVLGREKEMIRLGDGVFSTGNLSEQLMDLGLETLKKFVYLARSKGVQKFHAVATSAVREAHNGGDFLTRIKKELGMKVRIITGEEEGRLIYQGVKHSMQLKGENTLIVDVGGGSMELMVVTPDEILFEQSIKLGVARLKARFLKKERKKAFTQMEDYIAEEIAEAVDSIQGLGFSSVIGTSGTLNNLAAMCFFANNPAARNLPRSPSFTFEELRKLYGQLQESNADNRAEMRGLDSLRSNLILSGASLTYILMDRLDVQKITHCDKALREGMIYSYIDKNRLKIRREAEIPDVRRRSVLKLANKCDYDQKHAEKTTQLALQIFDRTQSVHNLSSLDRELLEYSALLHDIGYYIGYEKHHRHAYYLIKNVTMNGFSEEEIDIMALVARYHRRSNPKKRNPWFWDLPKVGRRRVRWLAGILKVADALDRSHFSVVEGLRVRVYAHKLVIHVEAVNDSEYELWEAHHKSNLLEKLVKRAVVFKLKPVAKVRQGRSKTKDSTKFKIRVVK